MAVNITIVSTGIADDHDSSQAQDARVQIAFRSDFASKVDFSTELFINAKGVKSQEEAIHQALELVKKLANDIQDGAQREEDRHRH